MSKLEKMNLKCNQCQVDFEVEVWESINIQEQSQLKERLFTKNIFDVCCPYCNEIHRLSYPILYHDPKRKLFIHLCDETTNLNDLLDQGDFESLKNTYTFRAVSDIHEFVEIIMINEYNLNDKIIELLKIFALNYSDLDKTKISHIYFAGMDDTTIYLDILMNDDAIYKVNVDRIGYDNVYSLNKEAFDMNEHYWIYVDVKYALNFINKYLNEEN